MTPLASTAPQHGATINDLAARGVIEPRLRIFRYVRFADVEAYLVLGWFYDGGIMHAPHGCYAVLMEFLCDCHPVEPRQ